MLNGTIYIVSDTPEEVPDRRYMISTGVFIENGPEAEARRVPTDKEMRVISTEEAHHMFGMEAERLDGVTVRLLTACTPIEYSTSTIQWLANDPKQLLV